MRLTIATPLELVVAEDDVGMVRAEDASGGFGIWPGHADFLTALAVSVLSWTGSDGARRHCAVKGGVLAVTGGRTVAVATRAAMTGELPALAETVLARFRAEDEAARTEQADATRLHLQAIRQIAASLEGRTGLETWR